MAKKVNPQGMKTSQFSQLKKPPVTEENLIFFFLWLEEKWVPVKNAKKIFFLLFLLHLACCPCELPSFFPSGAPAVGSGTMGSNFPSWTLCWKRQRLLWGHLCWISIAGKNSTSDLIFCALLIDHFDKGLAAVTVCWWEGWNSPLYSLHALVRL